MKLDNEYVKKVLKDNGYKFTNQRVKIYKVFVDNMNKHLTTEEVFKIVSKIDPEIGIATVYRTVLLFNELGLISQISFGDNITRYEIKLNNNGHNHHHLICLGCGKVQEVKIDLLDDIEKEVDKKAEEEKKALGGDIRDIYAEAKSAGFDVKIMRTIIKLRKMNASDREEQEYLLDTYRKALDL